jgi:hypothetical protein
MSKLGILAATALSLSLAVATPALAQRMGGAVGGAHVGGAAAGVHVGGSPGGFSGGSAFHGSPGGFRGGASFSPAFRGAQASIGRPAVVNGGNFAARGPQFAQGGWRGGFRHDHDHDRFRRGFGFAAGLAAGSALGFGYDPYYYDPYYYGDDYAYDDGYYGAYPAAGYVVSSAADPSYCARRYRSYDPASGTYLGYDGLRHPCP